MDKRGLFGLPPVRTLRGDVFIRLSTCREDEVVINSSLLKDSLYFARVFGNELSNVDKHAGDATVTLQHPSAKDKMTIHQYSLKFVCDEDEDSKLVALEATIEEAFYEERLQAQRRKELLVSRRAFLLEAGNHGESRCQRGHRYSRSRAFHVNATSDYGVELSFHDSADCEAKHCGRDFAPVHISSWSTGLARNSRAYLSSTEPQNLALQHAIIAHKVFFALLAGHVLPVHDIEASCLIRCLADVLTLAEVYDLLPQMAPKISNTLRQLSELWRSVSDHPTFFLALSVKLKDAELFADALRHICGKECLICQGFDEHIEAIEAAVEEQYPN